MRFIISLFMPKQIGRFFSDKIYRVIIYFIFFLALCFIPMAFEISKENHVTFTTDMVLFQDFKNSSGSELKIEGDTLSSTTTQELYVGEYFAVSFNNSNPDTNANVLLAFSEKYCNVIVSNTTIKSIYYDTLADSSLDVSKIQNGEFNEIHKLVNYLDIAYQALIDSSIAVTYTYNFINMLIPFLIVLACLMIASKLFNPVIPVSIRFKLSIYSMTWTFVLFLIGEFSGLTGLFYVGALISFIFNATAIKQIVKVDKNRQMEE